MQLTLDAGSLDLSYRNAHYLAVASDLAYGLNAKQQYLDQLGLTATLTSHENAQVYFCEDAANIVLAFRGSERPTSTDGLKDWLFTNAHIRLVPPPEGGKLNAGLAAAGAAVRFHTGFMEGVSFLWDDMLSATRQALAAKERPVWCTGHSLGGALAIMGALALARQDDGPVAIQQIYTFGAPMIGDLTAAEGISHEFRNRYFRFVNQDDLVPDLPINRFFGNEYRHGGTPEVLSDPDSSVPPVDFLLKALRAVGDLAGAHLLRPSGLITELNRRLDAHSIEKGYIRRIADRRKRDGDT